VSSPRSAGECLDHSCIPKIATGSEAYDQFVKGTLPFEHNSASAARMAIPLDDAVALPQFGPREVAGYTGASFDITSLKQAEIGLRTRPRKDEFIRHARPRAAQPDRPITNIVQ